MTFNTIPAAINNVHCRLFDHRSFLNGEIQFTLYELEERRNDKEIENIFMLLELSTNFKDFHILKAKQVANVSTPILNSLLDDAFCLYGAIENVEGKYQRADTFEIKREIRKNDWQQFVNGVSDKCIEVDKCFRKKKEKLDSLYNDLDTNRKKSSLNWI